MMILLQQLLLPVQVVSEHDAKIDISGDFFNTYEKRLVVEAPAGY